MIDYHLIADIALGDTNFQRSILEQYEKESRTLIEEGDRLIVENRWTSLHLRLKEYRNHVAPYLNKPALNRINAVLELLISSLNPSVKVQAFSEISKKIKREVGFLNNAA